jgi:Radical SAM superfamily.
MPDEIFEIVLQELRKNSVKEVMASPDLGDPLLAPNLIDKLKAIKKVGVEKIELTTNGILLNKIGIDDLLESADIINISIAGFDEEMCRRVYRVTRYQQIRNNVLELLIKNNRRENPKFIRVWLRGDLEVADQLSFSEIDIVKEYADELAVMTEVDSWNGKITQEMLTGTMKLQTELPKITNRPCLILLNITVHPDGNIHACSCRNINNDMDLYLGNIREIGFRMAYDNISKILDKWENGYIPPICQSCCMYNDPANGILGTIERAFSRPYLLKKG